MPLGWYLAQGLYPLGPSSSDDEEGPCELPDGRLVCGPHGLVICYKCTVDYSFMDDVLAADKYDEDKEEEEDGGGQKDTSVKKAAGDNHVDDAISNPLDPFEKRRGNGSVIASKFTPPLGETNPMQVFKGQRTYANLTRYICRDDPGIVLIYTDGACLDNGKSNPRAGWAFVHGPGLAEKPAIASGRLEMKGPFGDDAPQTSNRAELRAVIAALGFRRWDGEGFSTIVFATDSEYVVEGSTKWARTWVSNGWKTSSGAAVKNKDLWEALLGEFEMSQAEGVSVKFWRIPRALNTVADAEAKKAAAKEGTPEQWTDMMGLCI